MTKILRPTTTHPPRYLRSLRAIACLLLLACASRDAGAETPLTSVRVAQVISMPLFVTAPPGDTTRLFIVEQRGGDARGRIQILKSGVILGAAFLTTAPLSQGSEQGLLGLAFAPDYATSGRFYINYTRSPDGATVVERHNVSADPDRANPDGVAILTIPQPAQNHNGGGRDFGPDGNAYMTT